MESDIKQNPSNDNEVTQRRCNNCLAQGRNLVICIDGTSNQFGQRNTNVIELYNRLLKNKDQLTYYDSGIGTYAAPSSKSWNHWKQVIYNKIDVAIAWNFDEIVINAYGWLAQNYQPNDRIFLFGFSRGAYQVRTLAGMIDKVGLIHKGYERQIPFAYEIYADDHSDEALPSLRNKNMDAKPWRKFAKFFRYAVGQQSEPESPAPNRAKRFKDTFSRNIQVHFVGAWDTVSSVGIVRGKNLPGTTSADHICFFRHALALDECRVKFLPEYTYGGVAAKQVKTATMEGLEPMPRIKETWFAGTHSDIGGGNILNPNLNRCGAPLLWMSYEAISAGLLMELSNLEWKWDQLGDVHESLTGFWKIAEFLPITRLTYEDTASTTWHWHLGKSREIQTGQKIHASVAFSPSTYRPKAILPLDKCSKEWGSLIKFKGKTQVDYPEEWKDWLETDALDLSIADALFSTLERSDIKNNVERQVDILVPLRMT